MPELKFSQMVVFSYTKPTADFKIEDQEVSVKLTANEHAEILALCFRAYERNRQELANAILSAQPALLMSPDAIDAKWDEVPSYVEDFPPQDDIPF